MKRYRWLDIIKAICIIIIVLFHINYISNIESINKSWDYFGLMCNLFKVTIFYCIAGITLNNDKLKDTFSFLKHKLKKLYLKAIIIGIIAVLLHNILINSNFYKIGLSYSGKIMYAYTIKDYIINIIKTLLLANREVILGAFWFVWSLIICFIILSILEFIINRIKFIKKKREFRLFITFLLMFISIVMSNQFRITIPRFSNSLMGLFLMDYTNYLYNMKKLDKINPYLIISSIVIVAFAPLFGHISMNTSSVSSPYLFIIVVTAALLILLELSKWMETKKCFNFLQYVGKNSFSIMAFHFIGFKIGGLILNLFGYNVDIYLLSPIASNIFLVVYYLIFGLGISLLISYILKRIFKFEL